MRKPIAEILSDLGACAEAVAWSQVYGSNYEKAWSECRRSDHLLWLLGQLSGGPGSDARRRLVLCACACARTVLRHVPMGEERPLKAIEAAERWARGQGGETLESLAAASAAAWAAASAAAWDAAWAAASAAARDAAWAAASAAAWAAASAAARDAARDAAWAAASAAASAAARDAANKKLADLVRAHYPDPPQLPEVAP